MPLESSFLLREHVFFLHSFQKLFHIFHTRITPKVFGSFARKMKGSMPSDSFQKTGVCTSSPVHMSCTRTRRAPVAKVCFESILKHVCEKCVKYLFCRIQLSIPIHLETIVLCKESILRVNALCIDVIKECVFIFVCILCVVHMEQNCVMRGFVEKECFLLVRRVVLVLGCVFCGVVCVCMRMDWNPAFSYRKHHQRPEHTHHATPNTMPHPTPTLAAESHTQHMSLTTTL